MAEPSSGNNKADTRPNVILCLSDQLRPFELGCYGNRVVRTPNIDALAERSVRFETACSPNPVCTPARSILLSGEYSRSCTGMLGNVWEPRNERRLFPHKTLPELFKEMGYRTGLIGKWHIDPHPRLLGFDEYVFPKVPHLNTDQTYFEGDGPGRIVPGFAPEFEREKLAGVLDRRGSDPFFLYYNISLPHMPFFDVPERYRELYSPDEVPLRPNVFRDGRMAYDEHWFKIYWWDYLYYRESLPGTEHLPEGFDLKKLTACYYGMVSCVDDQIGELIGMLSDRGILDNTIIIFTADHGDNLGSHHLFNKDCLIEEAIRVPLLISWPKKLKPGVNTAQVASLVDIMPTLLGLLGADIPACAQGTDLSPILRGETETAGENAAFIECLGTAVNSMEIGIRTPTHLYGLSVVDGKNIDNADCLIDGTGGNVGNGGIKCQRNAPGLIPQRESMFFNLKRDPYEMENMAGGDREREIASELRQRLLAWNEETPWLEL